MKMYSFAFTVCLWSESGGPQLLAGFAYRDAAEKFARQTRNDINRDERGGRNWPVDEVRVMDEHRGRYEVGFLTSRFANRLGRRTEAVPS